MSDLEVDLNSDVPGRAVIEGKTSVPFKTFVTLVLQRKVQTLFKGSQEEPVILSSELLTKLASAPNDAPEDRTKLVLVTLGVGTVCGVGLAAAILLALRFFEIEPTTSDLIITLGVIVGLGVFISMLQGMQKKSGMSQKIYDSLEKVTEMIAK